MKPFSFSLQRVLDLRRRQLDQVTQRLLDLHRQQAGEEHLARQRRQESLQVFAEMAAASEQRGADLRMARNWTQRLEQERREALAKGLRLEQARRKALDQALQARRKVELLEKLRQRRRRAYERDEAREQERAATEIYLAMQAGPRRGHKTSPTPRPSPRISPQWQNPADKKC